MNHNNSSVLATAAHLGWIVPIPCLVTSAIYFMSQDQEVRSHARQGLFYQLITFLFSIVLFGASFLVFSILPTALASLLSTVISLGCLVLLVPTIMGAMAGFHGRSYSYPVIGQFAKLLPLP